MSESTKETQAELRVGQSRELCGVIVTLRDLPTKRGRRAVVKVQRKTKPR